MAEPIPRRRFLGGSLALAGLAFTGGCREDPHGTAPGASTDDGTPIAGDLDLLVALGQVEQTLAGAFTTLADARADDLEASGFAGRVADHGDRHREHAETVSGALEAAGVDPVAVASTFPGMAVPTERDLVDLPVAGLLGILARCEAAAAATGADAVGRLSLPELRGLVAAFGAADAGLAQDLQLAIGGGLTGLDQSDLVDGLLPLDRSYLAG
jgi:hypothetical protein